MPPQQDYESLARTLSANPDYRVLKRLAVKDYYNEPDGRALSVGIVLDTETTGLDSTDRVLQLGMLRFEFDPITGKVFRILDSYDALEDPGIRISTEAFAVHGITAAMVKGNRFDDDAVKRV